MINSTANIIARLEFEIKGYKQELKECNPSDKVQITLLKSFIEECNAKLSRYLAA